MRPSVEHANIKLTEVSKHRIKDDFLSNLTDAEREPFQAIVQTVIYVGCLYDLSPLLQFPGAETYIHLDEVHPNLTVALKKLEEISFISNLRTSPESEDKRVNQFDFQFDGRSKKIIEVTALLKDIPFGILSCLQAIYFFGVPYPKTIREIQVKLLPRLCIGGLLVGPYPYNNGSFEGAPPKAIGLEKNGSAYMKVQNLSQEEILNIQLKYKDSWY